jgi:hypothetical protein
MNAKVIVVLITNMIALYLFYEAYQASFQAERAALVMLEVNFKKIDEGPADFLNTTSRYRESFMKQSTGYMMGGIYSLAAGITFAIFWNGRSRAGQATEQPIQKPDIRGP